MKTLNIDMDGTIADLYGQPNWLQDLQNKKVTPYALAKPLCDMNKLQQALLLAKQQGYTINIVSWLAKHSDKDYNNKITKIKKAWLKQYGLTDLLDNIYIVPYGTPKDKFTKRGLNVIIDDEQQNHVNYDIAINPIETDIIKAIVQL